MIFFDNKMQQTFTFHNAFQMSLYSLMNTILQDFQIRPRRRTDVRMISGQRCSPLDLVK